MSKRRRSTRAGHASSSSPGLSGSGKSQAIRALEDLGYYCVDNLPVSLLPVMAELAERQTEHNRVAVVMDIREPRFVSDFPRVYRKLKTNKHLRTRLIFLEAGHAELVRRFSETRRPHPLAPDRPVTEGLSEERASLRQIRGMADKVIDTSKLNVHELRQQLRELVSGRKQASKLVLTILSFGFQNGPPAEADLMFDVRFLKNPHWVPALRPQTGKDPAVAAYIRRQPTARTAMKKLSSLLRWMVPLYVQEGKSYLTIAIGCTGGRHRSVYVAEALKRELSDLKGVSVKVVASRPGESTMIGVVVVTHGQLATELVNAAETIVGDLPNFFAVSIGWHEDVQDARDEIAAAIEKVKQPGGVLLATDMFGGTPSNLGITFLEQDKIEVVTGVNLPMLIKAASLKDGASLTDIARMLREHGRNAIWVASDLLTSRPSPSRSA